MSVAADIGLPEIKTKQGFFALVLNTFEIIKQEMTLNLE